MVEGEAISTTEVKTNKVEQNGMAIFVNTISNFYTSVSKDETGAVRKTPNELLMKFAPNQEWSANDVSDFILQMKANGLTPAIENTDTDFDFVYYLLPK